MDDIKLLKEKKPFLGLNLFRDGTTETIYRNLCSKTGKLTEEEIRELVYLVPKLLRQNILYTIRLEDVGVLDWNRLDDSFNIYRFSVGDELISEKDVESMLLESFRIARRSDVAYTFAPMLGL